MDPNLSSSPGPDQARDFYRKGMTLKADGSFDAALTEFRRAVLANPDYFEALMEVGLLCRKKSESDPFYKRHAFDAFKKAARLNLTNQEAHDHYIMAGQKEGLLDEIHREYEQLAKDHPDNELIKRCLKNILTISMAMVPEKVNVGGGPSTVTIRRFLLFGGLAGMFFGAILLFAPLFLSRGPNPPVKPENVKNFVRIGSFIGFAGAGMVLGRFVVR